ncbi:hypothetical protein EV702DRAFT_1179091 [Suillus placidus]|uniref:CxC1-like cysteine cluster associated with KDZ transposases domain-containing protein n=1 Tax=Suillus placidus TaxID=48579 RepID=A0A9P6ZYC6_9AGAM|nr:hypothetical protein EV702DRAFT_1179091 [Suillus placidus]
MYITAFEEITIITCPCFPALLQLLCHGLFPCAPMAPSLAVDLRVLEFVHLLFVCQSPNQTAWCDALETFLDGMGYKLTSKNSLRRRFSNVFHWYRVLTLLARDHISTLITDARKDSSHVDQPSEYLRSRCPLCFRGNDWRNEVRGFPSMPNIIVCIDACFTQKCSTNPRGATGSDPPNPTSSFFLPTANVNAMEDFVQSCRGERCQARASRAEPDEDCYEEGMCVPVLVLNGTRFFIDTGLMALLCRHDRVLWIANLTSVGEKQHYVLALLDRLFKHLPAQITIGLLYDIGCQLKWSCRKWKFMDNSILSCIAFAVAIFHAYGHQWPCQIVYHPRKREGFRLSDGEGCKRLWSFLKPLIPSLRVSGFNQRLFVLDTQIHHLDLKSLQGFGHWLHWHWIHRQTKKNSALDSLHDLQVDEHMLRVEWKAQVDHQMKPAPCTTKAAEVITTVLALEKTLEAQEASICELEMQLHAALGTEDKVNLEKMKKDLYLTVRLNALAVKTRICDHLRQRKFELERLKRSYRATVNAEHKLHANTQHSIKRVEHLLMLLCLIIIPRDGIFLLDVDDDIWQDIGLDDDTMAPPAWLSDDAVRNGICLQLEVDRCMEEEARLMRERAVIQEWMLAEWEAIRGASNNAVVSNVAVTDAVMSFHLRSHADELVNICVVWKKKVQCIPCAWPVGESWGPSDEALLQAARDQVQSSFRDEDDAKSVEGEEGDCKGDLEYGEIGDEELMDAIEDIALADEYRYNHSNELADDTDDIDDDYMPSSPIKLSNKCRRI